MKRLPELVALIRHHGYQHVSTSRRNSRHERGRAEGSLRAAHAEVRTADRQQGEFHPTRSSPRIREKARGRRESRRAVTAGACARRPRKDGKVRAQGRDVRDSSASTRWYGPVQPSRTFRPGEVQAGDPQRPRRHPCDAGANAERHPHGQADRATRHRRGDEGQDHPPPALAGGVQMVASGEAEIGIYPTSEVVGIDGISSSGRCRPRFTLRSSMAGGVTEAAPRPVPGGLRRTSWRRRNTVRCGKTAGFEPPHDRMTVTITQIAGGAPKPVFDRLGPLYEKRSGNKLNALYDSMSGIAVRVAAHEALDVLLMPVATIENYIKQGVVQGACTPLANIGLAVGVTAGGPVPDVSTPDALRAALAGGPRRSACAAGGDAERRAERQGDQGSSGLAEQLAGRVLAQSRPRRRPGLIAERRGEPRHLSQERDRQRYRELRLPARCRRRCSSPSPTAPASPRRAKSPAEAAEFIALPDRAGEPQGVARLRFRSAPAE